LSRGRLERGMSRTMSIACEISMWQSESAGQTGRTSIDMLCQDASKTLCPSSKLDMPALPLHGRSLRKGVRFSVQTTSPGRTPCKKWSCWPISWSPVGEKESVGLVVRVESMKLIEAQNKPDSDWVRVDHLSIASLSVVASIHAHSSTPVPPSLKPSHGRSPHNPASHLPVLKRRCSSFVCAWRSICPSERGKKRKFCASKAARLSLLRKSNEARKDPSGSGCRSRRS